MVREYKKPITFISINSNQLSKSVDSLPASAKNIKTVNSDADSTVALSADGATATEDLPPPTPWDNSLSLKGVVDSGIIDSGKEINLTFTIKANDRILTDGDLQLTIETKDFILTKDGRTIENNTYILEDFFEKVKHHETNSLTLTLCPDFEDGFAFGYFNISVKFVPNDMKNFIERMQEESQNLSPSDLDRISENGCIHLGGAAISYGADSLENWLAFGTSYGDVYKDITGYHYESGLISIDEMAKLCFGYKYLNKVCSAVCDYNENNHSMSIAYYSKNIRYESSFKITDSVLEEAILAHEEFWTINHYQPAKGGRDVTVRILEIMKEKGVITEEEFNQELSLLNEVKGIYTDLSSTFPSAGTGYKEINALHLTHTDK